jgi:hypothetical protein
MTDAAWEHEQKRLEVVNGDRRGRAKKAKLAKEEKLRRLQAEAFAAGQQAALRQGGGVRRHPPQPSLSPSSPAFFNEGACTPTPLYASQSPGFIIDLNSVPAGSTARHGPLPFTHATPARSGLSQAGMSPADAAMQELLFESQQGGHLDDVSQEWAAEDHGGENYGETMDEGEDEDVEEGDATTVAIDVEAEADAAKKRNGGKGKKWAALEDECLAEAWKSVSLDPVVGANQNSDKYWRRIKVAFDERALVDSEFNVMKMDRNESALSHRWATLQHSCNKWHDVSEEVHARPKSGKSAADLV